MDIESVREYCLSFPHATENVQWGADLVFKIAGKMFAVISLEETSDHCMSFKCTPEKFAELTERTGIVPAPYVARYHWVALENFDAVGAWRTRDSGYAVEWPPLRAGGRSK